METGVANAKDKFEEIKEGKEDAAQLEAKSIMDKMEEFIKSYDVMIDDEKQRLA